MYRATRAGLSLAMAIVATVLAACASAPSSSKTNEVVTRALDQVSKGYYAKAYRTLSRVIASPEFAALDAPTQHAALKVAGRTALELNIASDGYAFLLRSSAMPEAGSDDWTGRLEAARRLDQRRDMIGSLTQLARRWPQELQELSPYFIQQIVRDAHSVADAEPALHDLLDALYAARWTMPHWIEPSDMWGELAALELDRGEYARAREVIGRVQSPHVVISMRIDRRFDRLRDQAPEYFDVDAAVADELATMRAVVARSPRSLDAVVQLTYSLLGVGLYDDVLNTTQEVMSRMGSAGERAPYDDMDNLIWILDNRARALDATQRWDEAERELLMAARHRDHNVSNIINLAAFYADAGRPDESLALLQKAGTDISRYGLMLMHSVRYSAALQKSDLEIANDSFRYLEEHRNDALETWQWVLVQGNRLDEAAALLIERLGDPIRRNDALFVMQDYAEPPLTPQAAIVMGRWLQLRNRADVRQAIEAVGRIEQFRIPEGY